MPFFILSAVFFAAAASAAPADEYVRSAKSLMDNNDPGGAVENYRRAVELAPNNTAALLGHATSSLLTGTDLPRAKESLDQYIKIAGEDDAARRLTAFYHYQTQDYAKAVEGLNKIIGPGQKVVPILYYWRGDAYFRIQKYREALEDLNKVIEMEPRNEKALKKRGAVLMAMTGDVKAAARDFEKAVEIDPKANLSYLYMEKGLVLQRDGKHRNAIEEFGKAIKNADNDPVIRASYFGARADSWKELGDADSAIKDYSEAFKLNPAEPRYLSARAGLLKEKKQHDLAAEDYSALARSDPENAEALFALGVAQLSSKDQRFQGMDALYKAGNLYAKRNDRESLLKVIETMSKADPQSPLMQRLYKLAYPELNETPSK